jgi:hypothetical protein
MEALWSLAGAFFVGAIVGFVAGYPIGYVEGQSVIRAALRVDPADQPYGDVPNVDLDRG